MCTGAYVPMTMEGNILVDDVLASCYAGFNHDLAHITMTPLTWFPEVMQWIFGEDNGFQNYVLIQKSLGEWLVSSQQQN